MVYFCLIRVFLCVFQLVHGACYLSAFREQFGLELCIVPAGEEVLLLSVR